MNELRAIVETADTAFAVGEAIVLATVVRVRGSSYRRPGSRMLLTLSGRRAGGISGGCLESDVLRRAWWLTRDRAPVVVSYDSTVADDADLEEMSRGFGLGCGGVIEVLLERLSSGGSACPVAFLKDRLRARQPGVIATVIASEAESVALGSRLLYSDRESEPWANTLDDPFLSAQVIREAHQALAASATRNVAFTTAEGARVDLLLETVEPPPSLLICGAGTDAEPLARLAQNIGWGVTIYDPRPGLTPHPENFPGADALLSGAPAELPERAVLDTRTLAVVMTHNVLLDARLLAALLPSSVAYIGLLGPRRRAERILASLELPSGAGIDSRLHAPVGLDIGAHGPETVALSVLAEIQAVLAGRNGGFLRDRGDLPIHEPSGDEASSGLPPAIREEFSCALIAGV